MATSSSASYASGPSTEPLLGETIGDNLDRVAAAHPDVECLVSRHQGLRYTYAELVAAVDECARAFIALGVARGDRVQDLGLPGHGGGGEICGWVRLRDGQTLTLDELREYCQGRIAHYEVRRYLEIVDEFPMTVTGKIRKVEMRERSVERLGLDGAASVSTA